MLGSIGNLFRSNPKRCYAFSEISGDPSIIRFGVKGKILTELYRLGIATPSGFIIDSKYSNIEDISYLSDDILRSIHHLERQTGKVFGSTHSDQFPLLLSIRASPSIIVPNIEGGGAHIGMGGTIQRSSCVPDSWIIPGCASTVLNCGMNDEVMEAIAARAGSRFACDTYARFLLYYGVVVHGIKPEIYYDILSALINEKQNDRLLVEDLHVVIEQFKQICRPPSDPLEQVLSVVNSIYNKWNDREAAQIRSQILQCNNSLGMAVIISSQVFGNLSINSGTGTLHSRNPYNGHKELDVYFLSNAEGEDCLISRRAPQDLMSIKKHHVVLAHDLQTVSRTLERHFRDAISMEFAVQDSHLYITQVRAGDFGKRVTPIAALKIQRDLLDENLISEREILTRISAKQLRWFQSKTAVISTENATPIARGKVVTCGSVAGQLAFTPHECRSMTTPILCVKEFDYRIHSDAFKNAAGIILIDEMITGKGAMAARSLGKPSLCSVQDANISTDSHGTTYLKIGSDTIGLASGTLISMDANNGIIFKGSVECDSFNPNQMNLYKWIMGLAERYRNFHICAYVKDQKGLEALDVETPDSIILDMNFIMKQIDDRTNLMQLFLISNNETEKKSTMILIIDELKTSLESISSKLTGYHVTFKLADAPFEYYNLDAMKRNAPHIASTLKMSVVEVQTKIQEMTNHGGNSILGLRGSRVLAVMPEILDMQILALKDYSKSHTFGGLQGLQLVLPFFSATQEAKQLIDAIKAHTDVSASIGAIIGAPRVCFKDELDQCGIDFCIYDVLSLTELSFGIDPVDFSDKYMDLYLYDHKLPHNPFQTLDKQGVGNLINLSMSKIKGQPSIFSNPVKVKSNQISFMALPGFDESSLEYCFRHGIEHYISDPSSVPLCKLVSAALAIKADDDSLNDLLYPIF